MVNYERRQEDRDTRDIAVKAQSMVEQHMTDCEKFRIVVSDTFKEFREDLKKLNYRMALLLGGLIVVSKFFDWILQLPPFHHP